MGLRDEVINSLRNLFGIDQEERAKAESPSSEAAKYAPTSIYSVWGREDIGGLLSVSQNLMDRFADYEAMLDYPDIRTAVHYFATDATQPNPDNGRVVWVTAKDQAIVGSADAMIKRRLRLEDDVFSIAFQLCAMGNDYEEALCTENGLVGINCLPPATMRRIEKVNGDLIGYLQDITGRFSADPDELRKMMAGSTELPPSAATFESWQVVHFRLRSHARRSPYGIAIQEGARWIWKRMVMLLDAVMMGRLTKIPRYAYYVDVTDVPPVKRDAYLRKHKQELRKKQMVDPKTGRLDMRYNPACFTGDTLVPQLNGATRTLREMAEAFQRGEQQWVYSTDLAANGKICPGKVIWAGQTRRAAQLLKITLDNGESIRATPDHKFIRRSGEFIEAQALKVGDSLLPFRPGIATKEKGYACPGYAIVYDPSVKKSCYVHRVVASALGIKSSQPNCVIHHVDFNKLNNDPTNLQEMRADAHRQLHVEAGHSGGQALARARKLDTALDARMRAAAAANLTTYNRSPAKRKRTSELNRRYDTARHIRAYNNSPKHEEDNAVRSAAMTRHWADPENRRVVRQKNLLVFSDSFVALTREVVSETPNAPLHLIAAALNARGGLALLHAANPTKTSKIKRVHRNMLAELSRRCGYGSFAQFKESVTLNNHKVASIEWLTEREDTYCITVEATHTFALAAGVFVKNSLDEDIVLATTRDGPLARVEVLSAPDMVNMGDVDFLQRMMHGALMVPRAYMGQDSPIQGRAILSNEDVRAARVTLQVQKALMNGFEQMIRIDQAARGFPNPWQTQFQVNMTMPSGIYELAAYEIKSARADFAARIKPWFSDRWIRENVFKLSDEAIQAIEGAMREEALRAAATQAQQQQVMQGGAQPQPVPVDAQLAQQAQAAPPEELGAEPPPGPSPAVRPPGSPDRMEAIRRYDKAQRLEEARHKQSQANHQFLLDKVSELLAHDKALQHRVDQAVGLISDLREVALRSNGHQTHALPSARRW